MDFVQVGAYSVRVWDGIPASYEHLRRHASLLAEFDLASREQGKVVTIAITSDQQDVALLTSQHRPEPSACFPVGVLIVPETGLALIGASQRLLAFNLRDPEQLWEDHIEYGFLGFGRYDDTVLVSGELSLDAFDLVGQRRWSMFVEPPWSYSVQGEQITLDVMGRTQTFHLHTGPEGEKRVETMPS